MELEVLVPRFDPEDPHSAVENMALLADKSKADILAFIHDDVDIHEPDWEEKAVEFMEQHKKCGLLGFGGALGLGVDRIYKTPYELQQLARIDYHSNQIDWEIHGKHLTEPLRVTMLDGFALIFRRKAYEDIGGWDHARKLGLFFHCYDTFACCMMERKGWEVWALPIKVNHKGGGTSISREYDSWLRRQGIEGDSEIHTRAHVIIYDEFRDVLPWRL